MLKLEPIVGRVDSASAATAAKDPGTWIQDSAQYKLEPEKMPTTWKLRQSEPDAYSRELTVDFEHPVKATQEDDEANAKFGKREVSSSASYGGDGLDICGNVNFFASQG
ncbi:Hypothetical predicted protein [Lecanosticta acicola]|uniref:Uncharacterized protein n=1 Tax=Lecanosticta acicola TaxID=111012 RepID=A0AAI8Z547_9PEZI|nr:Hypothetical predicted protein [Lecanosticta acicola]